MSLDPEPWWRRWLLGSGPYAHWTLRWLALPLFRLVITVQLVTEFAGAESHGWTAWKIAGSLLLVLSIGADLVNEGILAARRRRSASDQPGRLRSVDDRDAHA